MLKGFPSFRLYITSLIVCIFVIVAIIYFEFIGLKPCPMCLLQQFAVLILSLISLTALFHHPKTCGIRIYSFLIGLVALLATLTALTQIWMQMHPERYAGSCQASVNALFNSLPLLDFFKALFTGTSDCSRVDWQFLGLSLAGYAAIFFAVLSAVHFYQFTCYERPDKNRQPISKNIRKNKHRE